LIGRRGCPQLRFFSFFFKQVHPPLFSFFFKQVHPPQKTPYFDFIQAILTIGGLITLLWTAGLISF